MRPFEKLRRRRRGDADQFRDHRDRDRRRELANQFRLAPRLEGVDQPVGEFGDARGEPLDLPGEKGAIDERAQPGVLGRLQLEQGMALDGVEGLEMLGGLGPAELLPAHHMKDLPAEATVA